MKKNTLFILSCLVVFLTGCSKYKVQYEGAYDDNTGVTPDNSEKRYEILYVESGKLYFTTPTLKEQKSFSKLPTNIVYASINNAHDRIAYKTSFGDITIIDSSGTQIATIANTGSTVCFDWHPNNKTLFYTNNYLLKSYGPSVITSISNFNTAKSFPSGTIDREILGFSVLEDGSVIYIVKYYNGSSYRREFIVDNITKTDIRKDDRASTGANLTWMKTTLTGDKVFFGGMQGSFSTDSYQTTTSEFSEIDYIPSSPYFFAPSANGLGRCYVSERKIETYSNNVRYEKIIDGKKVTALDW